MPADNIQNFLSDISNIVGAKYVLSETDVMAEYLIERRGNYAGEAEAIVLPANSTEVASVVKMCADRHIPSVPQGGNTGLCGGAVSKRGQIVLNLKRLNRITDVDPINDTMTVEAGCILADIQQAANDADRYFPLSLLHWLRIIL